MKAPWVPLAVGYRHDDAMLGVEPLAELLFVRALAFCKEKANGGMVTHRQLRVLAGDLDGYGSDPDDLAAQLVRESLWLEQPDGWLIRSWLDWNGNESSEAGRRGNHVRWHEARSIVDPECSYCARIAPESGAIAPDIAPESGQASGPSQKRGEEKRGEGGKRKKPATGAPAGFEVTTDLRSWAGVHAPKVNVLRETERFLDHHRAKGSKFSDWTAAWRNWMSRAEEYAGERRTPSSHGKLVDVPLGAAE